MAVRIELRCDHRNDQIGAFPKGHAFRCESHDNVGPMNMADNDDQDFEKLKRELFQDGCRSGWTMTANGWACRRCSARLQAEAKA